MNSGSNTLNALTKNMKGGLIQNNENYDAIDVASFRVEADAIKWIDTIVRSILSFLGHCTCI